MTDAELKDAGWFKLPAKQFSTAIGATWIRGEEGTPEVAVFTTPAIANDHRGMVHGGALTTFADLALGLAAGARWAWPTR